MCDEPPAITSDASRRALAAACVAALACGPEAPGVRLPEEADWREVGVVLRGGEEGAWDRWLPGPSAPGPLVEREGRFFLYYAGADGERAFDGGPRHRAIGVATSVDGVRFTKRGTPVMIHQPTGDEEEGANSAAVSLAADGSFVMHYGAATAITPDQIHASGRLATSPDGVVFRDVGRIVLDRGSPTLYGAGDEIFPIASYRHRDRWYVFYVPNGTEAARDLAVASGTAPDRLVHSARVIDGSPADPARVSGTIVFDGPDRILLFSQRGWHPNVRVEVRAAPAESPERASQPLRVYEGPLFRERTNFLTVYLDRRRDTWLLYRSNFEGEIVLHAAPAGRVDATPPSAPSGLRASATGARVCLAWNGAEDPESGVGAYRVWRDGALLGVGVEPWRWDAAGPGPHRYEVRAENLHGRVGEAVALTFDAAAGAIEDPIACDGSTHSPGRPSGPVKESRRATLRRTRSAPFRLRSASPRCALRLHSEPVKESVRARAAVR